MSQTATPAPWRAHPATNARSRTSGTARCGVRCEMCGSWGLASTVHLPRHPTQIRCANLNATRCSHDESHCPPPLIADKRARSAFNDLTSRCAVPADVRPSAYTRPPAGVAIAIASARARASGSSGRGKGLRELRRHEGVHSARAVRSRLRVQDPEPVVQPGAQSPPSSSCPGDPHQWCICCVAPRCPSRPQLCGALYVQHHSLSAYTDSGGNTCLLCLCRSDSALCSACRRLSKRLYPPLSPHRRRQRLGLCLLPAWQRRTGTAVSQRATRRPRIARQATSASTRTPTSVRCGALAHYSLVPGLAVTWLSSASRVLAAVCAVVAGATRVAVCTAPLVAHCYSAKPLLTGGLLCSAYPSHSATHYRSTPQCD